MKVILDFRKYDGVVGGVEQGAIQVARYACRHGHPVVLVCKDKRREQVRDLFGKLDGLTIRGLPIASHAISLQNARLDSRFLQDLAVSEGAALVHFYYNWSFPFRRKVPCILTVHDVIPFTFREAMGFFRNRFLYRPAMRAACRLNDVIVTVSEYSRQDLAKKVGVPLEKIRVIPNGLRDPAGPDPGLRAGLEKRFDLGNGYILNVGGIHERKNIERLVRAFGGLVRDHGYGGNLIVTGSVSGAPYQDKMKKRCDAVVAAAGMKNRVIFSGFVTEDELDNLLHGADLLIYPSLYEGFGIPILEAMKVGTPVVTSSVTAMPEIAGDAALLVNPRDPSEMTAAMSRILRDRALRERLVSAGRDRACAYSWDRTCRQYLDLYEEICSRRTPAGPDGGPA